MLHRLSAAAMLFLGAVNADIWYQESSENESDYSLQVEGQSYPVYFTWKVGRMTPEYINSFYDRDLYGLPAADYDGMVMIVNMPTPEDKKKGINFLQEMKFPLEDGSFYTQHTILQFPPVHTPDGEVNPNRDLLVLKVAEGPLPSEPQTNVIMADVALKIHEPDGGFKNDAYYNPRNNTGTTIEKLGQTYYSFTSRDRIIYGLPNRLYPRSQKVTARFGVYYYTIDEENPCSPYDEECNRLANLEGDNLARLFNFFDAIFFIEGRGVQSIIFEFVNVYGYADWIVATLFLSALVWSVIPVIGFPFVALNLFTLLSYYWFSPWIYLQGNPDAFKWFNWVATPFLKQSAVIAIMFYFFLISWITSIVPFLDANGNIVTTFDWATQGPTAAYVYLAQLAISGVMGLLGGLNFVMLPPDYASEVEGNTDEA